MPGAVVDLPPILGAPSLQEPASAQFMSMGREAFAFGALAAPAPCPGAAPESLLSDDHEAPGGFEDAASEGSQRNTSTTIHGEFFHAMISYRVASEGDGGSGLSTAVYDSLTRVSLEREFRLPRSLWGEWPSFAKRPAELGMGKAAKVYLDAACLEEGEPWEAGKKGTGGFAGALRCSVVFIPLLSFTPEGGGSLGQMMRLADEDYCDNVLLEFTVALGVWRSERLPLKSILPVLVGTKDKRGIYSAFPFGEVARLPDITSEKTNSRAAEILRRFGLEEEAGRVHGSTVRGVVSKVLSFQGVQLSNEGVHSKAVRAVGERALRVARKHVVEGMEEFLQRGRKVSNLSVGTPCGYEVLEWLGEEGLARHAGGFAASRVDSLLVAANLIRQDLDRIVADTGQEFASQIGGAGGGEAVGPTSEAGEGWEGRGGGGRGGGGSLPGDVVELELSVRKLRVDKRARTMQERLLWYLEESEHGFHVALTHSEGLETVMMGPKFLASLRLALAFVVPLQTLPMVLVWSHRFTVVPHDSDIVFLASYVAQNFISIITFDVTTHFLKLPPPVCFEWVTRVFVFSFVICFLGIWLVESLYFTGDNAVPDTLLREVRYPLQFATLLYVWILMRFKRELYMTYNMVAQMVNYGVFTVGCFLGEDPDSTAMAWVFLVLTVPMCLKLVYSISMQKATKLEALELVAPERDAFGAAWDAALAAEGGQDAAERLMAACAEVSRACKEEWRAFEKTVPKLGPHVWWMGVPLVREGLFTQSGKPRQASGDLDILFKQARVLNPHFQDWVKSWAGWGNGAQYVPGPVKHAGRVIEKCIRAYGRDAAAISDLVRCTVIYPSLRGVLDFFVAVRERSDAGGLGMLRIRRVKNRLAVDYDAGESAGYRDLSILVEVGWVERGGIVEFVPVREWDSTAGRQRVVKHICEIQVHVADVHEVKSGGSHEKYKMFRDLMAS